MLDRKTQISGMSRLHAATILTGSEKAAREILSMIDAYDLDPDYNENVTFVNPSIQ